MHRKYVISRIKIKSYQVESNNCIYYAVHDNGGMNRQYGVTYYLQFTNDKITITITIITDLMSIHCSN